MHSCGPVGVGTWAVAVGIIAPITLRWLTEFLITCTRLGQPFKMIALSGVPVSPRSSHHPRRSQIRMSMSLRVLRVLA